MTADSGLGGPNAAAPTNEPRPLTEQLLAAADDLHEQARCKADDVLTVPEGRQAALIRALVAEHARYLRPTRPGAAQEPGCGRCFLSPWPCPTLRALADCFLPSGASHG